MPDDELNELRAIVYGRPSAESTQAAAIERLAELERDRVVASDAAAPAETPDPGPATGESADDPPVPEAPPASPLERRSWPVVAAVGAAALIGGVAMGLGIAAAQSRPAESPATLTIPPEAADSHARVAGRWSWDPGTLRLGLWTDTFAVWVGTLDNLAEVCVVIDEAHVATLLCNPAGDYPSSFTWTRSSGPQAGLYRITVYQTGELEVAYTADEPG